MKKSTLMLLVSLMLALVLSVGTTLAYLTDTDADVNTMVLGNVNIVQNEQEWIDGKLDQFTQDKPLYPYVGTLGWTNTDYEDGAYRQFTMNNVVDKYVSVTNTGKSDAYVRTIIALEMGDVPEAEFEQIGVSINAENGSEFQFPGTWVWEDGFVAEIDGNNYYVLTAVHQDPVAPGATTIPSLNQVYLAKTADNEDVEDLDGNDNGKYDILVISQAVQAAGFADAETALEEAFGAVTAAKADEWMGSIEADDIGSPGEENDTNNPPVPEDAVVVDNVDDLKAALKSKDATLIYVEAGTYDMGGTYSVSEGTTVVGMNGEVVFNGTLEGTVKNLTFTNIHLKGGNAQRWAYASGDNLFENCTFEGTGVYAIHFDGTSGNLTYKNCDIIGWVAIGGSAESILFEDCTVTGNGTYGVIRVYPDATIKNCTFDVDNVNTTDIYQDGVHAVDCTIDLIGCTNVNGAIEEIVNVSGTGVVNIQ